MPVTAVSRYISKLSMECFLATLVAVLLLVLAVTRRRRRASECKQTRRPPGPQGLPVLGVFPSFLKNPAHIVFDRWTRKFGDVYQFKLGCNSSVVLGNVDRVREAFISKTPDVDSRCQWRYCFIKTFKGISVLPYSKKWQNTRRRTMQILKEFGMGKSFMEERIYEEDSSLISCMVEASDNGARNFHPRDSLRRCPMNILCYIMFGERHDYNNPRLLYVMNSVVKLVNILATASIYDILPSQLRRIAGFSLRDFHRTLEQVGRYMRDRVDEHTRTYRPGTTRDFVDAWLKASDKDKLESRANGTATDDQNPPSNGITARSCDAKEHSEVSDVIQDVVIAGAHSTGVVLHWIVLFLIIHKREQEKLHEDIVEVVGTDRLPSMADKPHLVRLEAFIYECHRLACVLPLVAHATCQDTVLGGYDVPNNTEVIYNNWTINHDETNFPEPYEFKSARWINQDGKMRKDLLQRFFPFGIGKRACAGESLAKMQLFITTATLIQKLKLLPPDESAPKHLRPEVVHQVGMLAECKPFLMRVVRRASSS